MTHRQQQLIDELVGEDTADSDHSLRGKALERAVGDKVPTTLTPWEWQEWYAEHGVPDSHRKPGTKPRKSAWWRRLLGFR
jgi:hypothetical protein